MKEINYDELNHEIRKKIKELCESIEIFSVIDNTEFISSYKNELKDLSKTLEYIYFK